MRIALALLLVGCVVEKPEPIGQDTDTGSDSDTGSGSADETPIASGAYQVRSSIDLTVEAVLPQMAADMVVTLRNFSTNPARTLLDLAEGAGVPAVKQIRDDLPQYVEEKLEGWINGEIAQLKINDVPVTQIAGNIASLAEIALTQFAIDSELSIENGTATHTLKTLDLTPAGIEATYSLEALPGEIVSATTTCASSNGSLTIGDHSYSIAYGEYVWRAVNANVTAQYGTDIRGTLGAAVNCPALATRIANKCYLGYCVGHQAQLAEICEKGLDEAVEKAHAKFTEKRIDAMHFAAGTATLVDSNKDGNVERLDAGTWTAEINVGMGLRHAPATFTATK